MLLDVARCWWMIIVLLNMIIWVLIMITVIYLPSANPPPCPSMAHFVWAMTHRRMRNSAYSLCVLCVVCCMLCVVWCVCCVCLCVVCGVLCVLSCVLCVVWCVSCAVGCVLYVVSVLCVFVCCVLFFFLLVFLSILRHVCPILGHFGSNLEHFGSILGASWPHLGAIWRQLGAVWLQLKASWVHLGASGLHLGHFLDTAVFVLHLICSKTLCCHKSSTVTFCFQKIQKTVGMLAMSWCKHLPPTFALFTKKQ